MGSTQLWDRLKLIIIEQTNIAAFYQDMNQTLRRDSLIDRRASTQDTRIKFAVYFQRVIEAGQAAATIVETEINGTTAVVGQPLEAKEESRNIGPFESLKSAFPVVATEIQNRCISSLQDIWDHTPAESRGTFEGFHEAIAELVQTNNPYNTSIDGDLTLKPVARLLSKVLTPDAFSIYDLWEDSKFNVASVAPRALSGSPVTQASHVLVALAR